MTLNLHYAAVSHRGIVRKGNQDSVFAGKKLLAVADGMGGMAAGDLASAIVINTITRLDTPEDSSDNEESDDQTDALADAALEANQRIADVVTSDPAKEGMGTTLTALLFDGEWFSMIHIGDSRGYRLRDERLEQVTKDDTYVQLLIDDGRITEEEAERHPQRSMLLRALAAGQIEPAFKTMQAQLGDRFMLCSDGLSGVVPFAMLQEIMIDESDPRAAADVLLQRALDGGAPDNVTVLVVDVVEEPVEQDSIIAGAAADQLNASADTATLPAARPADDPDADDPFDQTENDDEDNDADEPDEDDARDDKKKRGGSGKIWTWIIGVLLVVGLVAAGATWYLQSQFYVGTTEDGNIAVYRGLPGEFAGVEASWLEVDSNRHVDDATDDTRADLEDGISAGSLPEAQEILTDLTDEGPGNTNLIPLCVDPDEDAEDDEETDVVSPDDCRED